MNSIIYLEIPNIWEVLGLIAGMLGALTLSIGPDLAKCL